VIAIPPAPTYVRARAAWIATLVIWHADGRFTRLESAPCADYAAALAATWRLRPVQLNVRTEFVSKCGEGSACTLGHGLSGWTNVH
jgi:hypothetical protein